MVITILNISRSAAVLILAIVGIRVLMHYRLPQRTFLALWSVALCRLLIPTSVSSQLSIYTLVNTLKGMLLKTDTMPAWINTTAIFHRWVSPENAAPAVADTLGFGLLPGTVIWILGFSACVLFFLITHLRCLRDYKIALPIECEFLSKWIYEHPIKRKVQIRQSDKIAASLTYGLFRPVVLLPKTADWTDETKLGYILTHEYVHIRRFDILLKWLLAAGLCVHWFNPLVWVMYMLANRDIELSCDEAVVRIFGEATKSAYARTLIGLEEEKRNWTPLVNKFSQYAIEERINGIMKRKKTSFAGILLAIALVIGTTAAFATNAASAEEEHPANASELSSQSVTPEKGEETPPVAEPADTADKDTAGSPQSDLLEGSAQPSSTTDKGDRTQEPALSEEGTDAHTSTSESEDSGVKADDGTYVAYPVNQNGETYGNDLMAQNLGYEPDLMAAIGTEGQEGYVREEDFPGADVTTPEKAVAYMEHLKSLPSPHTIPLYDQEGDVIGEFRVG